MRKRTEQRNPGIPQCLREKNILNKNVRQQASDKTLCHHSTRCHFSVIHFCSKELIEFSRTKTYVRTY